jgi:hypothetical protein
LRIVELRVSPSAAAAFLSSSLGLAASALALAKMNNVENTEH